jgi:hypothetical protein
MATCHFLEGEGNSCRTREVWLHERGHDYEDIRLKNQTGFGRWIFGKAHLVFIGGQEYVTGRPENENGNPG